MKSLILLIALTLASGAACADTVSVTQFGAQTGYAVNVLGVHLSTVKSHGSFLSAGVDTFGIDILPDLKASASEKTGGPTLGTGIGIVSPWELIIATQKETLHFTNCTLTDFAYLDEAGSHYYYFCP